MDRRADRLEDPPVAKRRIERFAGRLRLRRRLFRSLRGGVGSAATLGALVKLKLAGSLGAKLSLVLLVGAGLAWPAVALAVLVTIGFVLAVLSLFTGEGGGMRVRSIGLRIARAIGSGRRASGT